MAKAKILIIEDDLDIAGMIEHDLKKADYDIISVSDGNKSLTLARKKKPDLIVLDVMLSSADGFEIYKKLKLDEATKYIPVIVLGAETQDEDRVIGLEFDVNDYVAIPFSPRELIARIKAVMRRIGLEDDVDELEEVEYVQDTYINKDVDELGKIKYIEATYIDDDVDRLEDINKLGKTKYTEDTYIDDEEYKDE